MNMHCSEARALLSPFHDGELEEGRVRDIESHLANCPDCRVELQSIRKLSELACALDQTACPPKGWETLESRLESPPRPTIPLPRQQKVSRRRWVAGLAAVVVVGVVTLFATPHRDHLAIDFDDFLLHFDSDIQAAEAVLVDRYQGRTTTVEEAEKVLGYRPVAAKGLLPEFRLQSANLLKMPCCECLQTIYSRPEGGYVVVFEHEKDQPVWFGDRPSISCLCAGTTTHLVEIDDYLAVTCELSPRYVTIIGPRSVEEVSWIVGRLVAD